MGKNNIARKRRMSAIRDILEREKRGSIKRLIAVCMYNWGISKRDAKEEIEAVAIVEGWKIEGDLIYYEKEITELQKGSETRIQD